MLDVSPQLRFVLVTGTVSAGKSTLAKSLERELSGWVRVAADGFANQHELNIAQATGRFGRISWDEVRSSGYYMARDVVRKLSAEGKKIILEATIPTDGEVRECLAAAGCLGDPEAYRVMQLWCSRAVAVQRRMDDKSLGGPWGRPGSRQRREKGLETYDHPLNCYRGRLEGAFFLDTEVLSPSEVLRQALSAMRIAPGAR